MHILPAIDLRGGKVVRLLKGNYDEMTVYSDSPKEITEKFLEDGASSLHVVDLDGALLGSTANLEAIKQILSVGIETVEVGGGIRGESEVELYLNLGVSRVIIGTKAITDPQFLIDMVKKYGEKIAVGVDAKDQKIAIKGWKEVTEVDSLEYCKNLSSIGVKTVIYTDISKDGALGGTNLEIYKELNKIEGLNIIASGGVSFEEEITTLKNMGTYGVIVGKAIYSGNLNLKRAIELSK